MTHDVSTSGPRGLEVPEIKNTGKITTQISPVFNTLILFFQFQIKVA